MILSLKRHINVTMTPVFATLITVLFFIILAVPVKASTVTWNLTDLTFLYGSNATGWFTYDSSVANPYDAITDWNIAVTYPSDPTVPSPLNPNVPLSNPINFVSGSPQALSGLSSGVSGTGLVYFASDFQLSEYEGNVVSTRCYLILDFLISGTPEDELADPANSPIRLTVPDVYTLMIEQSERTIEGVFVSNVNWQDLIVGQPPGTLTTSVPEPCIVLLLGLGLMGLIGVRRKFCK